MLMLKASALVITSLLIAGCASQTENSRPGEKLVLTQAEVDLMLEKARADERARLNKEINRQDKQKQVFNEILIARGEAPRFSTSVSKIEDSKQNKQQIDVGAKLIDVNANSELAENRVMDGEGGISKILPAIRGSYLYRQQQGKSYYYCTANSIVPKQTQDGTFDYTAKQRELSATLCKKSRDKKSMQALQQKLYQLGYFASSTLSYEQLVDGVWGETTLQAVKQYQQDNGLLYGQMTIQTLEHIGVFTSPRFTPDLQKNKAIKLAVTKPTGLVKPIAANKTAKINASEDLMETKEPVKKLAEESIEAVTNIENTETALITAINQSEIPAAEEQSKTNDEIAEPNSQDKEQHLSETINSDKPEFYREVGGAKYYRCTAVVQEPESIDGKIVYSESKQKQTMILCDKSRDPATITDLQYELYEMGYMPSDGLSIGRLISGEWDERTQKAVSSYQKSKGLLYGDLTIEILEHVGVFKSDIQLSEQKPEVKPELEPELNQKLEAKLQDKLSDSSLKNEPQKEQKSSESQVVVKPEVQEEKEQLPIELATSKQVTSKQAINKSAESKEELDSATIDKQAENEQVKENTAQKDVIPFVPLKVRLADTAFNASKLVPQSRTPEVYAYVGSFKLMRCRARAVLPEISENGQISYAANKVFRATLCKANRTRPLMTRLQTALRDKGFLKSNSENQQVIIDGVWGEKTLDAVKAYQQEHGLAYGQLTIETMEHLGVFITK